MAAYCIFRAFSFVSCRTSGMKIHVRLKETGNVSVCVGTFFFS